MRKGYNWGHRIERNQDNPRLKSICGDNIKYPRVKKAVQQQEYSQSDCLVA